MLKKYFYPLSAELQQIAGEAESYQLGRHISFHSTENCPSLLGVKIAIIGLDSRADEVRRAFYTLTNPSGLSIIDMGNIRELNITNLVEIGAILFAEGIIPIYISSCPHDIFLQYKSYQTLNQLLNMAVVSSRIAYSVERVRQLYPANYLNKIMDDTEGQLFHLSILGFQSHFANPLVIKDFGLKFYDYMRLGLVKTNIEETEPFLRDADFLAIDMSAARQSDAPTAKNASPNGLGADELCRLARYAGISDKMTSLGIFGFEIDSTTQTHQLIAQTIWYFIDGVLNRKNDIITQVGNFTEYWVYAHDLSLSFWKSNKSERWWLQVPLPSDDRRQRHRLISCSYNDYLLATEGELSPRLLVAFQRFG